MLKRTVSSILLTTLNNRRLFSLTSICNRQQQRSTDEYSTELNNQHRQFSKFHSRSSNSKKMTKEQVDFDLKQPQFNRYNIARTHSKFPNNKKSFDHDDENDIFSEEKDDLTMLGTDKKAFSSSITTTASKPTTNAVSLKTKTGT